MSQKHLFATPFPPAGVRPGATRTDIWRGLKPERKTSELYHTSRRSKASPRPHCGTVRSSARKVFAGGGGKAPLLVTNPIQWKNICRNETVYSSQDVTRKESHRHITHVLVLFFLKQILIILIALNADWQGQPVAALSHPRQICC